MFCFSGNLQWTPAGWVPKDNSHKVTTKMKPLPEPEVIPPNGSANYPEAAADRYNQRDFIFFSVLQIYSKVWFEDNFQSWYGLTL